MEREKALRELGEVPGMLARGDRQAAAARMAGLRVELEDSLLLRACEIMLECSSGRTDRAEILLGRSESRLREATMRDLNHFFLRLFMFHLDRGEMGCARRILDAGAQYGLGWRDFGMPYIEYCDRASLPLEGQMALRFYYPGIGSGDPGILSALRSRYPFLTSLPGLRREEGRD